MPKWIQNSLDLRTFKQSNTSYVNEELKEFFSDIVYDCKSKGGQSIQLSFLFEHKSFVPKNVYIQLNRYTTEAYQQQSLEKERKHLTVIIPIILYHGKQKWKQLAFNEHFELANVGFKKYIPTYDYELVDLNKVSNDWIIKIKTAHLLRSTLLVLKHKADKRFLYQFQEEIFIFVEQELDLEQKRLFLKAILTYIFSAFKFERQEIRNYLENIKSEDMVNFIKGSYADHIFTDGMEKGMEEGIKMVELFFPIKSLISTYPFYPNLSIEHAAKIANVKKEDAQKFYKSLKTKDELSIKKVATNIFLKKVTLNGKYKTEFDKLIKDFLKKKK